MTRTLDSATASDRRPLAARYRARVFRACGPLPLALAVALSGALDRALATLSAAERRRWADEGWAP